MQARVMGILNVTPDSFSDGGRWIDPEKAIAHGLQMAADGASVIDVGGESTRPGARPVDIDEEIARVVEVVKGLAGRVQVSIDTMKAQVAEAAVKAGASIINDVSASLHSVAADLGVGWIAMHMKGEPRTMQENPQYQSVVDEVLEFLLVKAELGKQAGIKDIWIDPGIGFGKTLDHNLSLLKHLEVFTSSPFPVVLGTSRKSFIGKLTNNAPADDRLEMSLASVALGVSKGVQMVRVHDVRATVRTVQFIAALEEAS